MTSYDEKNVDPIQEMIRLSQFSNMSAWGFKESFRSNIAVDKQLIYDSEWCRINIVWGGWDPLAGNTISIYYGRLHAPNISATMLWNDEECHAWHIFGNALHFLDGRSAVKIAKTSHSHPLKSKYHKEDVKKKFNRRQPEWLITMHMEVWDYYGKCFFELFDLRHPDLWEQYRKFLKELYDIKGRGSFSKPPKYKVC